MEPCPECSFELYKPIAIMDTANLGLYDDARFPGRSILSLHQHYNDLIDVPEPLLDAYMKDIRKAMQAIKAATGCERVNLAILGNAVPHVHAHLIPRYPDMEQNPHQSPWNDPRDKETLPEFTSISIREEIRNAL